jgi:release factor glutamine methyltransferase
MSEPWTVLRLLAWTTDYLKSHGSESPRLEAEVLLAAARGCERIMLYTAFDQVVDEPTRAKFRELVKRRAEGTPVAYLVGKREFYSLSLRVTPDVLIPRPETEFVVVAVLDALKGSGFGVQGSGASSQEPGAGDPVASASQNPQSAIRNPQSAISTLLVADVGTGSGAIAVAVAKHAAEVRVVAIDISPAALAIAQENAATHQVADRIEFLQGDLLSSLRAAERFAVIASNPPYISQAEFDALPPTVRDHEPRQALLAGPTGTETIERLIPQAFERLLPGGWLILEISPMIAGRVVELFAADGRFEPAVSTKDLAGLVRVVKARRRE